MTKYVTPSEKLGHSLRFHNMLAARGMPRMRLTMEMAERAAVWSRRSIAKECSTIVEFSNAILWLIWLSASD